MRYKMLCTDMDGTLLNNNKQVSDRNKKAIALASEKGVKVVICTGRLFTFANYYAELIGVKAPIIAANGAYIREKDRNEVIYKCVLGKQNCNSIIQVMKKYGLSPHFNSSDIVFTEKVVYSSELYQKLNKSLPEKHRVNIKIVDDWEAVFEKYDDEILKCIVVDSDVEKIKKAKEELSQIEELEVLSSWYDNIEIMKKGILKGRAVEILAGYYDLNREEIICIGDNENDLSMIKYAGMGVVMGNADDEIKAQADYVTLSNDEDGVAEVIEKFIL